MLCKVTTLVQFKKTYWIEAKELEHAYDEVVMNYAEAEASQEFLGETIIDGEESDIGKFREWLDKEYNKGTKSSCSYWMGQKLIHHIDYGEDESIDLALDDKKSQFDEWFYSPDDGGFALKAEYFYEDLNSNYDNRSIRMRDWMKAAYDAGREMALKGNDETI